MSFPRSALGAAACLCLGLSPLTAAHAQDGAADLSAARSQSQSIVLTSTREPVRIDAQLSDVTVIDRQQIEDAGGRTLTELLGEQPGVQMVANGGRGGSSSVLLRGTDADETLLLVDGVRYGSATLGQPSLDNIPLEAIERIEIVRGPLSSLYGADAAGGVVQIFTRQGGTQGFHPSATAGAGSKGYWQGGAGFEGASGPWSGSLHVQHQRDSGFSQTNAHIPFGDYDPDDDGFSQTSGDASVGYRINGQWRASARLLQSDGRVHYDDGPGVDAMADLKTQVAAVDLAGQPTTAWHTTVRASRTADDYDTLVSSYGGLGDIRTVQRDLSWENTLATPIGKLLGLLEHLDQDVSSPPPDYAVTSRTIDAAALGLDGRAGASTWQASVRRDHNSQYGNQNTGNIAYGYDLTPQWRASVAAGTSFVAPSFNQLYYPGYGHPGLLPQRGHNREATLRWRPADGQELSLTAYDNRITDFISDANTNVADAHLEGQTLSYAGSWRRYDFNASCDHLNARSVDGGTSTALVRRARNMLKAGVDADFGAWRAGATLVTSGARPDTAYDADFNPETVTLGGYALLDLHAQWTFSPGWTLQARLDNAGDRRYETAYGYNQPGRELYVTLRWAPRW